MLRTIFGGTVTDASSLAVSVASYQSDVYQLVVSIHRTVVVPISATVLGIIFTLELARQAQQANGDRQLGVQIIGMTMLKIAVLVLILENADLVLGAISEAFETITQGFAAQAPTTDSGAELPEDVEAAVRAANPLDQAGLMFVLVFPWMIAIVGTLVLQIVTFLRFMEIYILTAFVTLPLTFLGHPETKSIGIGYLRRYAAAGLQGAVLVLITIIFALVGPGTVTDIPSVSEYSSVMVWAVRNFADLIFAPAAYIALVLAGGRLARNIIGEG